MNLSFLKKVRVIISVLFLLTLTILFIDLTFSIQSSFSIYPLYLQFIPSLLKFIAFGTLASAGFIFIIILTALFGRVYCSTVCPLGILQDILIFLRNKKKKFRFSFTKPLEKTRYIILGVTTLLFLFGITIVMNLLDPYSNYGRIITNIFRPIIIEVNNLLAFFLESLNYYIISPFEIKEIEYFSMIFSIAVLILILFLTLKYARLYCNSICPVGTFLGLISKISLFKIAVIESNCIFCGDCETVCKSNCIESETQTVDFSRCVGCFNCFDVCPSIGISYIPRYSIKKYVKFDSEKRNFLKSISIFLIGSEIIAKVQKKIEVYKDSTVPIIRQNPISPPGSLSINNFTDKCTACHLCVASCPTQVLEPAFLEYGLLGIMQPRMNYIKSFCNYDCTICSQVCPSGAIINQNQETKKLIQLGKVTFVKENCVVYTEKTDCGACAEHCPTKAVKMEIDLEINKKAPLLNVDICIGCGACEFACPTKPYKSIYVESNITHLIAKKPIEEKFEEDINLKEEFPF